MVDESNIDNIENDGVIGDDGLKRDTKGRLVKGTAPGPGRPKGKLSIKDTFRKMFEEEPDKFQEFLNGLMEKDKALIWQMLEGKPTQTIAGDSENPLRIITVDKDLAINNDITSRGTETDSEG